MAQYNQGRVTVNIPDEFSLKDQDHKRIKKSVSEAIQENIKDRYPHIPIIELSYKKNYAELMKLRDEQR